MMNAPEEFIYDQEIDPCRIAIILAMTQTQAMEKEFLASYRKMGVKCAVTMISGKDMDVRNKTIHNVIGLCLNEGIIERKPEHIHPVVHAVWEATHGSRIMESSAPQNLRIKAAVVRRGSYFALCFYGNMAMHECSTHKTIGMGLQILGA